MTGSTGAAPTDNTPAPSATTTPAPTQAATPDSSQATPDAGNTPAPQDPPAGAPPSGEPPADGPVVPETYELSLPDDIPVDAALLERATPVFRELKLTNDQANQLAGMFAGYIAEQQAGSQEALNTYYQERFAAEAAQRLASDLDAVRADPEVGGARFDGVQQTVMDFIRAEGTPEFTAMVDSLGIANNPEFVRMFHRALHARPQDPGGVARPSTPAASAARALWPNLPSQGG